MKSIGLILSFGLCTALLTSVHAEAPAKPAGAAETAKPAGKKAKRPAKKPASEAPKAETGEAPPKSKTVKTKKSPGETPPIKVEAPSQ